MSLSDLIEPARRLAFVGLARNTGKTETLRSALRELRKAGRAIGVTSVGRDGEPGEPIDLRFVKPRIDLPAWSLLASTEELLRASGVPYEPLVHTGIGGPLGDIVLARLLAAGTVALAGPTAARDVRSVCDAMLAHGAEQVLIDGAVDRRAASSPAISEGLVMSTGAVLHREIERVVSRTREAVELARLAEVSQRSELGRRIRGIAAAYRTSVLLEEPDGEPLPLHRRFVLRSTTRDIDGLLREHPAARHVVVRGALCEPFVEGLLRAARGRSLELTVADSTKVFLTRRGCAWYERQGISIRVLAPIHLRALTVNPVAPWSHSFNSQRLRALLQEAVPDVPVLDVRDAVHELVPAA